MYFRELGITDSKEIRSLLRRFLKKTRYSLTRKKSIQQAVIDVYKPKRGNWIFSVNGWIMNTKYKKYEKLCVKRAVDFLYTERERKKTILRFFFSQDRFLPTYPDAKYPPYPPEYYDPTDWYSLMKDIFNSQIKATKEEPDAKQRFRSLLQSMAPEMLEHYKTDVDYGRIHSVQKLLSFASFYERIAVLKFFHDVIPDLIGTLNHPLRLPEFA